MIFKITVLVSVDDERAANMPYGEGYAGIVDEMHFDAEETIKVMADMPIGIKPLNDAEVFRATEQTEQLSDLWSSRLL